MGRTRKEVFVALVVDECFGDNALIELGCRRSLRTAEGVIS
jgi:hypothetical protein